MNKIIFKENLASNIKKIIVQAPEVAKKQKPGQFVVVIIDEKGERLPLTIVDSHRDNGTITLIFQGVGRTTDKLGKLAVGSSILGLLGPLGMPTEIKKVGRVVTVAGGVGIAEAYPVTRAFQEAGNQTIAIVGVRNKSWLILEEQMRRVSHKLLVSTDDGSYGYKGFVSDLLKDLLLEQNVDLVYAVGPVPMMRKVCQLTRAQGIKTMVSLNPIMVDATGMCGACRVSIKGQTKFACVDGPEFDGHLVDFDLLEQRLKLFAAQEKQAREPVAKQ